MYGQVLSANTTAAQSSALPNTGGSDIMAIAAIVTIAVGVVVTVTTLALAVAKRAHNKA